MKKILLILCAFLSLQFSCIVNASNASDSLIIENNSFMNKSMGDSSYLKNDYISAVQIYESLLKDGESSELYYNLGNSYYKMGEIAKAILNYERGLLLNPGDADLRFNLNMAKSKTVDKVEDTPEIFLISWAKSLINLWSINTWAIVGIIFFLFFITCLYFFIFSKQVMIKKIGFFLGLFSLLLVIFANIFAGIQKKRILNRDYAIVMTPNVVVRSTPSESGTNLFVLHEGHKILIKDNSMKNWKEIRLNDGKVGWVPSSSIEVI